jgi:asparagine synthase (glutamine-hydrolysing)
MKVRKLVTKYILKRSMERLLPTEIIYRKKEGFPTPIANWLRTELKDFTMETLCSSAALSHGLFDRKAVRSLVDAHMRGTQNNNRLLFPLINFEIWHKLFFSKERMETVNWKANVA